MLVERPAPVPIIITKWKQSPRLGPTYDTAESEFIVGITHTGKSNKGLATATQFLAKGHRVIDPFGAENDAEELAWFNRDSPYRDVGCIIVGDGVNVKTEFPTISVDEFTLEKVKQYDVVATTRLLYGSKMEHYAALAKIFEVCKSRRGWKEHDDGRIINLFVREAWNLILAVMRAHESRDQQEAQYEFIDLHNQRFHSGIAPTLDTQDFMSISQSVKRLVSFKTLKGFGGGPIPDELEFLFKPHLFGSALWKHPPNDDGPWKLRNMPPNEFIMLTNWNGVAKGIVGLVPWGINKGEDLIEHLNIEITPKERKEHDVEFREGQKDNRKRDLHAKMEEAHARGLTAKQIAEQLQQQGVKMIAATVRWHLRGDCACKMVVGQS